MILAAESFNDLLDDLGQRFVWRRSYACPCINAASGAAKPSCPLCSGKGRQWADGIEGKAGIGGQRARREFAQMGVYQAGDVVLTIPSDSALYEMGPFDRVLMVDATLPFSLSLKRGQNDKLHFPVERIIRVFWLNPAGDATVDGGIPVVAADGSLTWTSGEPPSGSTYSVTGRKHAEYYVYPELPSNRNEHSGESLPRKVMLRGFDLFGR
jgi:hypothetical protein